MDHNPITDPAAAAASVAASIVAESSSNNSAGMSDSSAAFSLTLGPKEPPDVAFDRLCKVHQGSGFQQECQVCQRYFPNWYKLKQHLHTHADFRPYTCTYCDKTFRNYSKKSRHEKTHSGLKPYVCKICDKHVTRSEHLKRHLLTHTDSHPFKCINCEYRSRRLDCIRYHMKNKHPEKVNPKIMLNQQLVDADGDHPNDASDILWQQYKDSTPESLALVTVRPEQNAAPKSKKKKKKKSTTESSASFPYPEGKMPVQYPGSMTNMLGQQFNLPQFPSTMPPSMIPGFSGFTSLNHIKNEGGTPPASLPGVSQHTQTQPVSNGQKMLEASFTNNDDIMANRNKFFLSQVTEASHVTGNSSNNLDLPRNMCGICEKAFDCPSKLQRHQNTHAGIRPYKCDVCGKALSRPEHLKRHLMTHDPDKSHVKPPSYKSKSKKSHKSTVSTSAHAILSQASMVQSQSMQPPHQRQGGGGQDASGSRVKQESEKHQQQHQQQQQQQGLTCQVVQQKTPPLTAASSSLSQQQQQQQHYIMATAAASQHQQQLQQHQQLLTQVTSGSQMIPWSMSGAGQAITINATTGLPMTRALEPQLVATTYSPHVAVLHSYAAFGAAAAASSSSSPSGQGEGGSGGAAGQPGVMYQRAPANMILNANASSACGLPVFPPITEMR